MDFAVPLLSRQKAQPSHSVETFSRAALDVKELYLESTKTSSLLIVDTDGYLRMAAVPQIIKAGDGTIAEIRVNLSDTEFIPGKLPPTVLKHFVGMAPKASVPAASHRDKKLTTALLDGAMAGTSVTLFALPIAVPIRYGAAWIEGFANDPGVQDQLEHEYGSHYKAWAKAVVSALDNQEAIAGVFQRVKDAGALATHLGSEIEEAEIHLGDPSVPISVLTKTLHPQTFEERRQFLGPYKTAAVTPPTAPAGGTLTQTAVDKLATAMTTKEDRREAEKLRDGLVSTKAVFMAGVLDKKKGEITSLAIPTTTQAFTQALKQTTIAERARKLKRMLDTNNRARPAGSTNAVFRDMANHDINLVKVLVTGDFSQVPIADISAKIKEFNVAGCLPHLQDLIDRLNEEQIDQSFDESVGHEDATTAGSKRKSIAISVDNLSFDALKSMFANFESIGQTIFVCDSPGIKPFVVIYAGEMLSFLLLDTTKRWFAAKNTPETQVNFVFFVLQRFDEFLCKMAMAGEDFQNHEAIEQGNIAGVSKEKFEEATEAIADNLSEMKKLVSRGQRVKDAPDFLSDHLKCKAPAKPSIAATRAGPPTQPPAAPAARPAAAPKGGGWNANKGWGQSNPGSTWEQKKVFNAEESKKKGDLFVKDGFARPLAAGLEKIYCSPFVTIGKHCGNPECKLKHRRIEKWEDDHKKRQLAHVDANRDKVLFNVESVRSLPENKKYLLGTKDGPVSGERR